MTARKLAEDQLSIALQEGNLELAGAAAAALDALPPKPAPSIIGAALWYATNGLPVFPLQTGSKIPLARSRGVKDATTDLDAVRAMFTRPDLNIGLATGYRIDVIDFDGPDSHVSWRQQFGGTWEEAEVTVLATVSTPRAGGLHVYVPTPDEGSANRAGIATHVDYRGMGGYVVAPPSRTPQGSYRFLQPLDPGSLA